ncbi:MAG: hypothetical protein AABW56_03510, partial [Nanoarchaeota archaeon]
NFEKTAPFKARITKSFLYLKNEPVLFTLDSPFLDLELASQAVKANKKQRYFSIDRMIYDRYMQIAENEKSKEPEHRGVLILPERKNYEIPTRDFNGDELMKLILYMFG